MAEPFPWAAAMRFGLGRLHISPRDFWAMTPRELAAAMGAVGADPRDRPDRATLEALASRWPDARSKPQEAEGSDDPVQ